MPNLNVRLEVVYAVLAEAGILDQTLVVLTSDHGMELHDAARQGSVLDRLDAAHVRYVSAAGGVYFKTMLARPDVDHLASGETTAVQLTILDADTVDGPEELSVVGATVTVSAGAEGVATSGASGLVTLELTPHEGAAEVVVTVTHAAFNARSFAIPVQQ
jgi:hypothetical protein